MSERAGESERESERQSVTDGLGPAGFVAAVGRSARASKEAARSKWVKAPRPDYLRRDRLLCREADYEHRARAKAETSDIILTVGWSKGR